MTARAMDPLQASSGEIAFLAAWQSRAAQILGDARGRSMQIQAKRYSSHRPWRAAL
jgi:hypothetical protein